MKQFILSNAPDNKGRVRLSGSDYHYLVRVRRLAPGERFPALLPSGEETLIAVCSVTGGVLLGECCTPEIPIPLPGSRCVPALPPIILFQALPKGEKMDLIVRQAAEGGLSEVVPFVSEFSLARNSDGKQGQGRAAAQKTARWQRIIKEARQQSGSTVATAIRQTESIDGLFAYWETIQNRQPNTLGILFHHLPVCLAATMSGGEEPARQPLEHESLHGYLDSVPETVVLAVGPEGGFSDPEVSRFLAAGFRALTIGDTVLRTETAALYAAAAIRVILLERNSWEMKKTGNGSNS